MTVTVDAEILRRLRVEAATRNISVPRFVGELLRERFGTDDRYEEAMADFFSRGAYLSPAAREDGRAWPAREEIYAGARLSEVRIRRPFLNLGYDVAKTAWRIVQ